MSSANWAEVTCGKGLVFMLSKLETSAYPALLFPSKTTLLPSVYPISSELVRGSSENPSRCCCFFFFPQWSKVSRQEWKGREPSRVGRRVVQLRTSQGDIAMPEFSISTTWYLRILRSDNHKWPLPFRSCFTWWVAGVQPWWIQGIRRGDGFGDQDTIALIKY